MSKQKQKTICVHNMFWLCCELGIFVYSTGNSINNLLSYCGLVDARISTSEKDLPVLFQCTFGSENNVKFILEWFLKLPYSMVVSTSIM